MKTKMYRFALFMLLFGISSLPYTGDFGGSLLDKVVNLSPLFSMAVYVTGYFRLPALYKLMAWGLVLGVILLILESKYQYDEYFYSYFVIKRFAYFGIALSAYYFASQLQVFKIKYAVDVIFILFFINQVLMGRLFSYNFSNDSRTTYSPEAYYFLIPFLYYLVRYLKEHRLVHLFASFLSFLIIVAMLHRTVISAAVVAAGIVIVLAVLGKVSAGGMPLGRTLLMFALLMLVVLPFTGLLPEQKVDAVLTSLGGILSPKEDNTGSWRVEQAEYYLSKVPERPLFGWRYDGYDQGEIMENEDFPEKGTIIHSQYIDLLYNYGAFGVLINLVLILSALIVLYRSGQVLSTDQLVLFGFIASGLVYGVSYQLPVHFWAFVGVGMYVGLKQLPVYHTSYEPTDSTVEYDSSTTVMLSKKHTYQ